MKTTIHAVILYALSSNIANGLGAFHPHSSPATSDSVGGPSEVNPPVCALTTKWIVAIGEFTDPLTNTVKSACFVYDNATLRFLRRIPLAGSLGH